MSSNLKPFCDHSTVRNHKGQRTGGDQERHFTRQYFRESYIKCVVAGNAMAAL